MVKQQYERMTKRPSLDSVGTASTILMARQPIFDSYQKVFGYELLYRGPLATRDPYGSVATARVIWSALGELGLDRVSADKWVFINCDQYMLEEDFVHLLPSGRAVVEILEDVIPTPQALRTVASLRAAGISIALDDFCFQDHALPFLPMADFVKVDVLAMADQLAEMTAKLLAYRIPLLAEKVEKHSEFQMCASLGYQYFQGYFFAQPESLTQAAAGFSHIAPLQVFIELQQESRTPEHIAHVIGQDVALVNQILRLANSALLRRRRSIESIADAVVVVGEDTLRRWVALLLLTQLSQNKPSELMMLALIRGRFCERLCVDANQNGQVRAGTAFTAGVLSVVDALLDRPLESVLRELNIRGDLAAALLGDRSCPLGRLLGVTLAYETGDWAALDSMSDSPDDVLAQTYYEAVELAVALVKTQ